MRSADCQGVVPTAEYDPDQTRDQRPDEYDAGRAYLRLHVCQGEAQAIADCQCTLTQEDDGDVALHMCSEHLAGSASPRCQFCQEVAGADHHLDGQDFAPVCDDCWDERLR